MEPARTPILSQLGNVQPTCLYHYTSLDALLSIVQHGSLWASNIRYMNDSSEFAYSLQLLIDRVLVLFDDASESEKPILRQIATLAKGSMNNDVFVTSFSGKRDDLSQWRAYCPPGLGVCIGFRSSSLRKATNTTLKSVLTDGVAILAQVLYITNDYGPSFDDTIKQAFSPDLPEMFAGTDSASIVNMLTTINAAFCKNAAFKDEDEWRLSVAKTPSSGRGTNVRFRVGKSTLVPYLEIDVRKADPDFISEVVVGPSPNIELSVEAVKALLSSRELGHVEVKKSEIPYRHW